MGLESSIRPIFLQTDFLASTPPLQLFFPRDGALNIGGYFVVPIGHLMLMLVHSPGQIICHTDIECPNAVGQYVNIVLVHKVLMPAILDSSPPEADRNDIVKPMVITLSGE